MPTKKGELYRERSDRDRLLDYRTAKPSPSLGLARLHLRYRDVSEPHMFVLGFQHVFTMLAAAIWRG